MIKGQIESSFHSNVVLNMASLEFLSNAQKIFLVQQLTNQLKHIFMNLNVL